MGGGWGGGGGMGEGDLRPPSPVMCKNYKIQKHFQNVMLVGMASETSKNYTYKCVDRSRHNGIKCAH